ncbi:hypothetical protein D3C72_1776370 [compost metagenome]
MNIMKTTNGKALIPLEGRHESGSITVRVEKHPQHIKNIEIRLSAATKEGINVEFLSDGKLVEGEIEFTYDIPKTKDILKKTTDKQPIVVTTFRLQRTSMGLTLDVGYVDPNEKMENIPDHSIDVTARLLLPGDIPINLLAGLLKTFGANFNLHINQGTEEQVGG